MITKIQDIVLKMVADQVGTSVENVKKDVPWEEQDFDSLDRVELIIRVEKEFEIDIDDSLAESTLKTPQNLIDYLENLEELQDF